ncbi:unnamed protein product [Miscanthus lutarioriparius]|uniref:Uncharacterized protein n=1 Tax=Miscanthus lutarioriparius TaxID=422564 RepID=A0A811NB83_9POAL|nr:unnamed protein product [Miscanthus lutarioriparius]
MPCPYICGLRISIKSHVVCHQLMDLPGPRWKKGKDGKDFAALTAANPMSTIIAQLQAKLRDSEAVATLAAHTRDAILEVGKDPHRPAPTAAASSRCEEPPQPLR